MRPRRRRTELWDGIDAARDPDLPVQAAMPRATAVAEAVLFALTRPPGRR